MYTCACVNEYVYVVCSTRTSRHRHLLLLFAKKKKQNQNDYRKWVTEWCKILYHLKNPISKKPWWLGELFSNLWHVLETIPPSFPYHSQMSTDDFGAWEEGDLVLIGPCLVGLLTWLSLALSGCRVWRSHWPQKICTETAAVHSAELDLFAGW